MPSWQERLIMGSNMLLEFLGQDIIACPVVNTATAVSVWPHNNTTGKKAEAVWIRPTANVRMAINAVATTYGPNSALLAQDQEYGFTIHPSVHTLTFLDAQSGSNTVYIRWMIER